MVAAIRIDVPGVQYDNLIAVNLFNKDQIPTLNNLGDQISIFPDMLSGIAQVKADI